MPYWTIQYVYPDQSGNTRISIDRLQAETKEEATQKAAAMAPAEEFMITVFPETDEQALGSVRQLALEITRDSDDVSIYEEPEDDDDEDDLL